MTSIVEKTSHKTTPGTPTADPRQRIALLLINFRRWLNAPPAPIQALRDRGLILSRVERVHGQGEADTTPKPIAARPALSVDQRQALMAISEAIESQQQKTNIAPWRDR